MKKIIFFIVVVLISCKNNNSMSSSNGFHIKTSINQNLNGKRAYLKTNKKGRLIVLDSTIIENGKFEFKGIIEKPIIYGIYIENINEAIGVFMENKMITIQAFKDSLSSSRITGSQTNDDYLEFVKKSNQIISKMNVLFPSFQKARAENDAEKLKIINKEMQAISDKNTAFSLDYAKKHSDSYIGALALHSIIRIPTVEKDSIAKIYNNFSDYVKKGDLAMETLLYLDSDWVQDTISN